MQRRQKKNIEKCDEQVEKTRPIIENEK